MDINKLSNRLNGQLEGARNSDPAHKPADSIARKTENGDYSDKVSLGKFPFSKDEHLYARHILDQLNQPSFEKLRSLKSQISEYRAAQEISESAAAKTSIGKMLSDPDIHLEIAKKILR